MSRTRWASGGLAIAAAIVGALGAFGCVIAALFERDGFGRPRDTEPRSWYLLALAVGLGLCIAVPAWIGSLVWGRRVGAVATLVGLLAAAALFGLTR